jgi:hypothetical protein
MATNFALTLDTTAPAAVTLAVAAGAAYVASTSTTANVTTSDGVTTGYQMKVWGDINGVATEGAAAWVGFDPALPITLTTGDGLKTVNVRVRDDVGNESTVVTDTVTLDTASPVPNITVAAAPTKISKIATFDTSTFTFAPDIAVVAWKVKVVPAVGSTESAGTTIPTAAGSLNVTGGAKGAGVATVVTIKGADLEAASSGDGAKIVKVFAQGAGGTWST